MASRSTCARAAPRTHCPSSTVWSQDNYDGVTGTWLAEDGSQRCYRSTDNLVDPPWRGRPAEDVIAAIHSAGLELNPRSGTGAVLHMFIGLDIDGLIGLTTIGRSPAEAEELHQAAAAALGSL